MQNLQYEKTSIVSQECQFFCDFLEDISAVESAVLFGSMARGDNNYHSDADLAIWIKDISFKENTIKQIAVSYTHLTLPTKRIV